MKEKVREGTKEEKKERKYPEMEGKKSRTSGRWPCGHALGCRMTTHTLLSVSL